MVLISCWFLNIRREFFVLWVQSKHSFSLKLFAFNWASQAKINDMESSRIETKWIIEIVVMWNVNARGLSIFSLSYNYLGKNDTAVLMGIDLIIDELKIVAHLANVKHQFISSTIIFEIDLDCVNPLDCTFITSTDKDNSNANRHNSIPNKL